jgi:hypothetical protein
MCTFLVVRSAWRRPRALWSVAAVGVVGLAGCRADPSTAVQTPTAPTTPTPPTTVVVPASRLPLLRITTSNNAPITSRDVYLSATYRLTDTSGATLNEGTTEIRGRGNSTWDMPKKPYRLRLTTSTPLMGMPTNRHWVLLANFSDKTLMRNDFAFELSRIMGFEWTPRSQTVDVELNGRYDGVYQLVEHVRIGSDRVNIPELRVTDTTASAITGGYLIEIDERSSEAYCPRAGRTGMVFCLNNPETLNDAAWVRQRNYITNYLFRVDTAIFGPNFASPTAGYAAFIDVKSMIDYFILQELAKNVDGNLRLSTYLYKKRDGKLFFGPMWDFDISFGNANYFGGDVPEGWLVRTAPWFTRLWQDPAFVAAVRARWSVLKAEGFVQRYGSFIQNRRTYLSTVQERNFTRWPILNQWVWPNRGVFGSYRAEVSEFDTWVFNRFRWMDSQLGN